MLFFYPGRQRALSFPGCSLAGHWAHWLSCVWRLEEAPIEKVSVRGGHLAPNLGVVELTMALHYAFHTPDDLLVWDIGHQAYVHKLLTGRRDRCHTIRPFGGLSGYLRREESPYDVFGASHASTSISAALGLAAARDLQGKDFKVVG